MATRYTLTSTLVADNQLARLGGKASSADRLPISRASHAIDRELSEDAELEGDSVAGLNNFRKLHVPPLRVYFQIDPDALTVEI